MTNDQNFAWDKVKNKKKRKKKTEKAVRAIVMCATLWRRISREYAVHCSGPYLEGMHAYVQVRTRKCEYASARLHRCCSDPTARNKCGVTVIRDK